MHTDYVLLLGRVFPYEEKAPFESSGKSVWGGLELENPAGRLKCHECGELHHHLGAHVVKKHEMSAREYKLRHHLHVKSSLISPTTKANCKSASKGRDLSVFFSPAAKQACADARARLPKSSGQRNRKRGEHRINGEARNVQGKCPAQLVEKLRRIAEDLGRSPSNKELCMEFQSARGILGGAWISELRDLAGVKPEPRHGKGPGRISDSTYLQALQLFFKEYGRCPRKSEFSKDNGLFSAAAYQQRFGGLGAAFSKAGLPAPAPQVISRTYSKAILIEWLIDFYALNDRLPTTKELGGGLSPSWRVFRDYFGGMANAFMAAGLVNPGVRSAA